MYAKIKYLKYKNIYSIVKKGSKKCLERREKIQVFVSSFPFSIFLAAVFAVTWEYCLVFSEGIFLGNLVFSEGQGVFLGVFVFF